MGQLTEKREAFAEHYAAHRNGPAAYVHAFNVSPETKPASIATEASKLLADPEVTQRIDEIVRAATAVGDVTLKLADVFKRLCLIATTDPRELTKTKVGNCRHCHGEDFGYRWRDKEYENALADWAAATRKNPGAPMPDVAGGLGFRPFDPPHPDCPECGGLGVVNVGMADTANLSPGALALYEGVKQTKNGIEILTFDRAKAIDMIVRMMGGFQDNVILKGQLEAAVKAVVVPAANAVEAAQAYEAMLQQA